MTQILQIFIYVLISLVVLIQGLLMFKDLKKDYGNEKKKSENEKKQVKNERKLRLRVIK